MNHRKIHKIKQNIKNPIKVLLVIHGQTNKKKKNIFFENEKLKNQPINYLETGFF